MRTAEGDKIFRIIRSRIGRPQAISSLDICRELKWPISRDRMVRQTISDESHIWPAVLVCAVPGQGYFCAETYQEAENYDNWLSDLVEAAQNKRTAFRTACQKMGFRFAQTNRRAAAKAEAEMSQPLNSSTAQPAL